VIPASCSPALRAALAAACLAGCGSKGDHADLPTPYMRPAELGASSALYFTVRNPSSDTLVLIGAEIDVAEQAGFHQSMDHNGMASMHPIDSLVVLPGDSVRFSERGLHVMATGLRAPLGVGDTVAVRLRYRGTRVDTVRVLVRE
jgi:copper(I)-binding protein